MTSSNDSIPGLTVLKVGGSLFDLPDLPQRILALVRKQGWSRVLVIAGGGELVEQLRRDGAVHNLSEELCHDRALDLLGETAAQLADLHPRFELAEGFSDMGQAWKAERIPVLDPRFIPRWRLLPASWDVTSDSLAAWAALQWSAHRLVLAKSVTLPSGMLSSEVAAQGMVDGYFPILARGLECVEWTNLRELETQPVSLG